ncbi:MAG: HNH endonuclease domain-containing protein, partial [Raoultibacter sp.]
MPQAYVKDDSFENKVLVRSDENQRKLDSLLLEGS